METCDTEVGHEAVSNFLIFPSYRIHPVSWQQLLAWAVVQCTGIASLQMASVAEQLQGLQNSRVLKKLQNKYCACQLSHPQHLTIRCSNCNSGTRSSQVVQRKFINSNIKSIIVSGFCIVLH